MDVRIGFGFAYPKRAQKLLVGRFQTLLIYLPSLDNDFVVVFARSKCLFRIFSFSELFIFVLFHLFVWVFVH